VKQVESESSDSSESGSSKSVQGPGLASLKCEKWLCTNEECCDPIPGYDHSGSEGDSSSS